MLDSATDPHRHINLRANGDTGDTDLMSVGHKSRIHCATGGSNGGIALFRQTLQLFEPLGGADAHAAGNDHLCLIQRFSLGEGVMFLH